MNSVNKCNTLVSDSRQSYTMLRPNLMRLVSRDASYRPGDMHCSTTWKYLGPCDSCSFTSNMSDDSVHESAPRSDHRYTHSSPCPHQLARAHHFAERATYGECVERIFAGPTYGECVERIWPACSASSCSPLEIDLNWISL